VTITIRQATQLGDKRLLRQVKLMRRATDVQQRLARLFARREINEPTFRKAFGNDLEFFFL
jgi:hypothetical protein